MRKVALVAFAALAFGAAPYAGQLGAVGGPLALVLLGVLLALTASGALQSLAVASGSAGAFAAMVIGPVVPAAGGAVLALAAYAERTTRVRSTPARLAHLGAALVGGALAGALAHAFQDASFAVRGVAAVVAAVLLAIPQLVEADDPVAHALDGAAAEVSEPARAALREGAALRRGADDVPLEKSTARQVTRTWRSLSRLAEARVRLEKSRRPEATAAAAVTEMVDRRIADHVAVLARTLTAADTARAAKVSLDDAALKSVQSAGESLEDLSEAIVETKV